MQNKKQKRIKNELDKNSTSEQKSTQKSNLTVHKIYNTK